jgi:large subunit ribosomal protein L35Ae
MMGVISHFRGSFRRKRGNQLVVVVPGVDNKDKAKALLGKKAVWITPGKQKKQITGKVSSTHGNKGALRVVFEKGLPGQSLGQEVKIE